MKSMGRTFYHQRHEGNDGRIQFGDCESIRSVVPGRILQKHSEPSEIRFSLQHQLHCLCKKVHNFVSLKP